MDILSKKADERIVRIALKTNGRASGRD